MKITLPIVAILSLFLATQTPVFVSSSGAFGAGRIAAMTTTTASTTTMRPRCRVAVIGFGPAGMFFCHHLERRRRKLIQQLEQAQEKNKGEKLHPDSSQTERQSRTAIRDGSDDADAGAGENVVASLEEIQRQLSSLPRVTCFEKADGPGGVWRSQSVTSKEALWTNGCKEVMEFFDYTFADHYGVHTQLPSYLPRTAVLDYMLTRVTRQAPDFVERYAQFRTKVTHVTYCAEQELFTVQTKHVDERTNADDKNEESITHFFDKVIWAAGVNGKPRLPDTLWKLFQTNFTRGPVLHSAQSSSIDWNIHVTNKHVVVIGGSYSAEDIALMALKQQARHVTIVVRNAHHNTAVLWPHAWPCPEQVTILTNVIPSRIDAVTQTIECTSTTTTTTTTTTSTKNDDNHNRSSAAVAVVPIENADTIFFCTGYDWSQDMIDQSVLNHDPDPTRYDQDDIISLPADYGTMTSSSSSSSNNDMDNVVLLPPPPASIRVSDLMPLYFYHGCVSTRNPHYIMIDAANYDAHLLAIDVLTHFALSYILGETIHRIPSATELVQQHRHIVLHKAMPLPYVRCYLDLTYEQALHRLYQENDCSMPLKNEPDWQAYEFYFLRLAQTAYDGRYPVDLGNETAGLSPLGQRIVNMDQCSRNYNTDEDRWTTFRDLDLPKNQNDDDDDDDDDHDNSEEEYELKSIHTGNRPVAFHSPWMQLDDSANPVDLVHQQGHD